MWMGFDSEFNLPEQAHRDFQQLPVMAMLHLAHQAAGRVVALALDGVRPALPADSAKQFEGILTLLGEYVTSPPERWDPRQFELQQGVSTVGARLLPAIVRCKPVIERYERVLSERTGLFGSDLHYSALTSRVNVGDLQEILDSVRNAIECAYTFWRFGDKPLYPYQHRTGVYNCCGAPLRIDRTNRETSAESISALRRICRMPEHEFVPIASVLGAAAKSSSRKV